MKNIDLMRPHDLHEKALLLREKSGEAFFLEEQANFVDVPCPACHLENNTFEFRKYGFAHLKCKECKTLYVSPRPTESLLFKYYTEYEAPHFWTEVLVKTNNDRKYLQHLPRVEKLAKIINAVNNKKGLFVDLGAGNGNFSKAVLEKNIFKQVIASDISKDCVDACQAQGLNTHKGTISDFDEDQIDCIVFNDLIEHVFSPYDFVKKCFKALQIGGVLMLSTPNGEGFDFQILKDKTENITPPEHIQYFNPSSIKFLLNKVGFKIFEITTPGILDVEIIRRQRDKKVFNLKGNNEFLDFLYALNRPEMDASFQEFLAKNNLSSHMLVFAIKT